MWWQQIHVVCNEDIITLQIFHESIWDSFIPLPTPFLQFPDPSVNRNLQKEQEEEHQKQRKKEVT